MGISDIFGVAIALGLTALVASLATRRRMPRALRRLIYAALFLRVFGALVRYFINAVIYGGSGDSLEYFEYGWAYALRFRRLDFSPFYDSALWMRDYWWGTSFVPLPTGFVLSILGPSLLGGFIVFSLFAFLGLVGFGIAFRRAFPGVPPDRYLRWIFLFPSLWFWPSSVGKEALVMMGIGLTVWGYVGSEGRKNWALLVAGSFLVFVIRPQVCAVLLLSFVLAQWLSLGGRWTPRRVFHGVLIVGLGLGGITKGLGFVGVESLDVEGITNYMETEAAATTSGSTVEQVGVGLGSVPVAIVNILARPFIWEAGNVMALASAIEVILFWSIVWRRRKNLRRALKTWRSHELLRFAVPFVLIYTATLGIMVVNLGIIARQRIFLFPFLFMLLEADPAGGRKVAQMGQRRPPPQRLRRRRYPIGHAAQ